LLSALKPNRSLKYVKSNTSIPLKSEILFPVPAIGSSTQVFLIEKVNFVLACLYAACFMEKGRANYVEQGLGG
jgi:hypothetical protein